MIYYRKDKLIMSRKTYFLCFAQNGARLFVLILSSVSWLRDYSQFWKSARPADYVLADHI